MAEEPLKEEEEPLFEAWFPSRLVQNEFVPPGSEGAGRPVPAGDGVAGVEGAEELQHRPAVLPRRVCREQHVRRGEQVNCERHGEKPGHRARPSKRRIGHAVYRGSDALFPDFGSAVRQHTGQTQIPGAGWDGTPFLWGMCQDHFQV